MVRRLLVLGMVLLVAGCGPGDQAAPATPAPATVAPPRATPDATAAPALAATPQAATLATMPPVKMAEGYVRAVYAGNDAMARVVFPWHTPETRPNERKTKLESLTARALTREEARDHDPFSQWHYAEVKVEVSYQGQRGRATYKIGMRPMPEVGNELRIGMIIGGSIDWDKP